MTDLLNALGYVAIFASIFCCIVLCLVRWNNTDQTLSEQIAVDGSAGEAAVSD